MRQENDPWSPMTNAVDLKYLGKLAEECGELNQAIGRCIIQGIDGAEPDSRKVNRTWLQEEIADVLANIKLVTDHFELDSDAIEERAETKKARLRIWHEQA